MIDCRFPGGVAALYGNCNRVRAIGEGWDATRTELEVLRASRPRGRAVPVDRHV